MQRLAQGIAAGRSRWRRHLGAAIEIGAVAEHALVLLRERLPLLMRAASGAEAGGAGTGGRVPM